MVERWPSELDGGDAPDPNRQESWRCPSLDASQIETVNAPIGPIEIRGEAGSGKTLVLAARSVDLLRRDLKPVHCMVLTLNRQTSQQVQQLLWRMIGDPEALKVRTWTFDLLCAGILSTHTVNSDAGSLRLAYWDQRQSIVALGRTIRRDLPRLWSARSSDLAQFLSWYRTHNVLDPAATPLPGNPLWLEYKELYERIKKQEHAYDGTDLRAWALRILDDRDDVRRSFRHYLTRNLLVDDFENIAPVEYELVTRLIGPEQSVTVATDPDQRIYDWRGLLPNPSAKFAEDYPNATRYELRSVHRVPSQGLPPLQDLTKRRDLRETKECDRTSIEIPESPFFEVVDVVGRPPEQYERIAHDVKRLISGGWLKAEEIAILARRRGTLMRLPIFLAAHGVPVTRLGGLAGQHDPDVRSVAGMLSLVINPRSVPHFLDACSGNPVTGRRGLHRKFAEDVINAAKEDNAHLLYGVRKVQRHVGQDSWVHAYLTGFQKTYTSLVEILGTDSFDLRNMMFTAYDGVYAAGRIDVPMKPTLPVKRLYDMARIEDKRFEDEKSEGSGTTNHLGRLEGFIAMLKHSTIIGEASTRSEYSLDLPQGVSLGSLHSAKGLEWSMVIIADVAEHVMPGPKALGHTVDTAREFRLLEQAMLRASERCVLYWSHEREDGTAASLSSFINPDG